MGKRNNGWFSKAAKGQPGGGGSNSKWPANNSWKTAGSGQALGGSGDSSERRPDRDSDVPHGYQRIKEGGDGDCLFHALARQALGDTNLALQARREVCEWMERQLPAMASATAAESELSAAHRELIRQQREELTRGSAEEVHRYVEKMRRRGEWGTGLEALAAAYVYRRPVHVWSPDGFSELRAPSSASSSSTSSAKIVSTEPIRLIHNGRNHWDSLAVRASDSAAPPSGPSAKARSQAEKAEEDLAFALSLSMVESFPSVPLDERTERRRAAALAAEARLQKLQTRGLGKPIDSDQAARGSSQAGQPQEDVSRSTGAPGSPQRPPSTDTAAAAAATTTTTASSPAPSPVVPPIGPSQPSGSTGPWDRRRAARLALESAAAAAASREGERERERERERAKEKEKEKEKVGSQKSADDKSEGGDCTGNDNHETSSIGAIGSQAQDLAFALLLEGHQHSDQAVAELEACLAALEEAGLAAPEAQEALLRCGADVKKVKELYCIDWDETGHVVHSPFQPPAR